MAVKIFLLIIAFSLSACSQIRVDDAAVSNSKELNIERLQLKTLDTKTRQALNATNPDALIAVFDEKGVTLYGAPGKEFKYKFVKEPLNHKSTSTLGVDAKDPVNDVIIKTFKNSPLCNIFLDMIGNGVWYPSDCPK